MKILCSGCGKEIEEKKAILRHWLEEDFYYCSPECEEEHKSIREQEAAEDEEEEGPSE